MAGIWFQSEAWEEGGGGGGGGGGGSESLCSNQWVENPLFQLMTLSMPYETVRYHKSKCSYRLIRLFLKYLIFICRR